jgi:enamine deaminase RidA (YjgF/YER057c/UK114 family)
MMPATPDGKQVTGSVAEMTHQMCRNTAAVLQSAGSNLEKTVKVTVRLIVFHRRCGNSSSRH